jgi:hypothetical protein
MIILLSKVLSAGHMQDRIGLFRILIQCLDGFGGRKNDQFDSALGGCMFHLFHHRQCAVSPGADDQPTAFPGNVLLYRERRMPEGITEFLGRLLLSLADLPSIDHHVVLMNDAVDPHRTKGKILKAHAHLLS